MSKPKILKEFEQKQVIYESLEKMTNSLLSTLIANKGISVHSITSRTKSYSSLHGKIDRPGKSYQSLANITDIVGIRVTTYFSDEVDEIAALINNEFNVDLDNSIDKRKAQEPDRFGYMSLHLVSSYSLDRTKLQEYSCFDGIKFEIQIRSILQHAWAEIEHDIGYKSEQQVPDQLKRRFSRLSGLLELADEEFLAIKNGLKEYKKDLPEQVTNTPEVVSLNLSSLESLVKTNSVVIALENEMKTIFGGKLTEPTKYCLSNCLDFMVLLGYQNLSDILLDYAKYRDDFLSFLTLWLNIDSKDGEQRTWESVETGISLLYLTYIKLADTNEDNLFNTVLNSAPFINVEELTSNIKEVWAQIKI